MNKKYPPQIKHHAQNLRKKMTVEEAKLWQFLRKNQIENTKFRRQQPMLGYILDFYAPAIRLAIEIDGAQHFDNAAMYCDMLRTKALKKKSITILRYTNAEINHQISLVLQDIFRAVVTLKVTPSAHSIRHSP